MEDSGSKAENLTFEQLAKLREQTEAIAGFLRNRLQSYLETLRPLFAPRRLLGKYIDRKEDVSGSEKAAAQVREKFEEVCGAPFSLTPELDDDILAGIDNRPELYPWEYTYEAKGEGEARGLTITSPVRWVLTYGSGYTLSQVRQALAGKHDRRTDAHSPVRGQRVGDELVLCEVSGDWPTPFRPPLSSAAWTNAPVWGRSLCHPQCLLALVSSGGQPHPDGHAVLRRLEFCRTDRC